MKIDLNYLNRFSRIDINNNFVLDEKIYNNSEVRNISDLHAIGKIEIDFEDNLIINLCVTGKMILPSAITLKDVNYDFTSNIEENIGKFEEIYKNTKNTLEISQIIWENIVLEIPIRVVDENEEPSNTAGDGWELISE